MQLFYTPFTVSGDRVTVTEPRVLEQLRKVLRAQEGYEFAVQYGEERLFVTLIGSIAKEAQGAITRRESLSHTPGLTLLLAMPNKLPTLELLAQKLTELGLDTILLRRAQRSQLDAPSPQKYERMTKIMIEALEQSRWARLPHIAWIKDPSSVVKGQSIVIADKTPDSVPSSTRTGPKPKILVIGPEGGLTDKDYALFTEADTKVVSLGETVLRLETAAMVGSRRMMH